MLMSVAIGLGLAISSWNGVSKRPSVKERSFVSFDGWMPTLDCASRR